MLHVALIVHVASHSMKWHDCISYARSHRFELGVVHGIVIHHSWRMWGELGNGKIEFFPGFTKIMLICTCLMY